TATSRSISRRRRSNGARHEFDPVSRVSFDAGRLGWLPSFAYHMCIRRVQRAGVLGRLAQRPERVANLPAEDLGLLPRGEVSAGLGLMEVNQIVIGLLGPAPRRHKALAWERGHGGRDRD